MNDPATAVQALDAMEGLLSRLGVTALQALSVTDDQDDVRVVLRLPIWMDFLHISLDDLLAAATKSPMVLLRARGLLRELQGFVSEPRRREPLAARLDWVERELADRYPLFPREAAEEASA